jgi:hypothetical protein
MTPLEFCQKYLKNYTINPDGIIDVDGNVDLSHKLGDMKKLPVKFGKVSGDFDCYGNFLTTLNGCPDYVGYWFDCEYNELTTLEGCPKYIGSDVCCDILTHHILGNVQGYIHGYDKRIVI